MRIRRELERKISKKEEEIAALEKQVTEAKAFLEGLKEALKSVPKIVDPEEASLRVGSDLAKTKEFLQKHGKPAHIAQILAGIGKEDNKKNRTSLSGSLGSYARKGQIFVRTVPYTFGLIGMEEAPKNGGDLPEGFGLHKNDDPKVATRQ